jgi:hypothetical protein
MGGDDGDIESKPLGFFGRFLRPKSMSSPENANHRANPVHSRGVSVMLKQLYLIQST